MSLSLDLGALADDLDRRLPRHLDLLRQMVAINSFTRNPAGVDALGDLTAAAFAELGFAAERVPAADPAYGRHLVLTRPGAGAAIGLVSHLDTVFSPEEEARNDFAWRVADDRIYGPGTVDIKGGTLMIYMLLDALRRLAPAAFDGTTWTVLLNAAEEELAPDFGELCLARLAAGARACLVFEIGNMVDGAYKLVNRRKGLARIRVSAEGRGAHSGNGHAEGANAIVQLADAVGRIAALTDYERELTVNVGAIRGGTVTNRVPHYAEAAAEVRALDSTVFEQGLAGVRALDGLSTVRSASGGFACRTSVAIESRIAPWPANDASERLLDIWRAAASELGTWVVSEARGGLSDGNWTWRAIPTIDGLGPAGGNMHCSERSADGAKDQEYVLVSSFVPKALLNLAAIGRLIAAEVR